MPVSPEAKRGRGVMVLTAVLLVAVLGIGGWFAAYKINTDKTIATQDKRIEKLQRDLEAKTGELRTTKDDLAEAEDDLDAAYKCMDAAQDLLSATDEETADKAVRSMLRNC
jgi:type VI protein secretion system component VasK